MLKKAPIEGSFKAVWKAGSYPTDSRIFCSRLQLAFSDAHLLKSV